MTENECNLLKYYERTVKECMEECDGICIMYNKGNCECVDANVLDHLRELQQYRAIGTVRGYERAIETSEENYNLYREYKALLREYEAIGTIEEFKALKEKCVAKKPLKTVVGCYKCSCCGATQIDTFFYSGYSYCHNCGTKIDWQ